MVQFLSIIFFFLDFFNFCCVVFQKFPSFCVILYYPEQLNMQMKIMPTLVKTVYQVESQKVVPCRWGLTLTMPCSNQVLLGPSP